MATPHMKQISILRGSKEELDIIKSGWQQLNSYHESVSKHFAHKYTNMNWEKRKKTLIHNAADLMFDYVLHDKKLIAYCVSSVHRLNSKIGEIDSLFVDEAFRSSGIGKTLVERAMDCLLEKQTEIQKISVAVGNDNVLDFYKQFDFYPSYITLRRKPEDET